MTCIHSLRGGVGRLESKKRWGGVGRRSGEQCNHGYDLSKSRVNEHPHSSLLHSAFYQTLPNLPVDLLIVNNLLRLFHSMKVN